MRLTLFLLVVTARPAGRVPGVPTVIDVDTGPARASGWL